MADFVDIIDSPVQITVAAERLRQTAMTTEVTPDTILDVFETWAGALGAHDTADIPGVAFPAYVVETGDTGADYRQGTRPGALHTDWMQDGRARLKAYPIGVVGHWPAGNMRSSRCSP